MHLRWAALGRPPCRACAALIVQATARLAALQHNSAWPVMVRLCVLGFYWLYTCLSGTGACCDKTDSVVSCYPSSYVSPLSCWPAEEVLGGCLQLQYTSTIPVPATLCIWIPMFLHHSNDKHTGCPASSQTAVYRFFVFLLSPTDPDAVLTCMCRLLTRLYQPCSS